jgi:hypothetical protein
MVVHFCNSICAGGRDKRIMGLKLQASLRLKNENLPEK